MDEPVKVYRPVGCQACGQKGYNGRISLAEIIMIDSGLQQLIDKQEPTSKMKQYLQAQGVDFMRQDGLAKSRAGLTSIQEVGRIIQLAAEDLEQAR